MALSEEHKAKLIAGRARWREQHAAELEQKARERKAARTAAREAPLGVQETLERIAKNQPPPSFVESQEFKDAVAAAAHAAVAPLLEKLNAARAASPTPASPMGDDMAWARSLAMAMAEVADQGTDRKRVAPEILAQRAAAAEELQTVLAEVRASGERPVYQLKNKVQVVLRDKGETVIEPLWLGNDKIHYPTEISSPDMPNLAMIPINEPAKRIYALFLASIGSIAEQELQEPEGIAMTRGGTVVRGNAALQVARQVGGDPSNWTGHDRPEVDFAEVRRHQPSQTKDVRVLGTIQPPARQNA